MLIKELKPILAILIFSLFVFIGCGDEGSDQNGDEDQIEEETGDSGEPEDYEAKESPIICLWSAVSIKKEPNAKGKWVTTIYLGEKGTYLGETVTDTTNKKKPVNYNKVKLIDGTEGWVQATFMAIDAIPYALKEGTKLYKRPDILTASKDEFDKMQYVVVLEEQGDWVKVKGKKRTAGWFKEGWIKKDRLTSDEVDITVAILAERAMGKGDESKKLEALNEILENTDLSSSVFSGDVRTMVDELTAPEEETIETEETNEVEEGLY